MLLGLARALADRRPERGRVVLLFQPAEETGHGARTILADPAFAGIAPDRVLAVHNLPGFPLGTLVLREGPFASASCGLEIILTGVTSHAAEPERGLSPVPVAAELALQLPLLPAATVGSGPGGLVTVVGVDVGSDAFGVSPGTGRVLATLRTATDDQMAALRDAARRLAGDLAARSGIAWAIRWHEEFPGTANDANIVGHLTAAAERAGIPIRRPREPFRWSEDFGHFTARWPGALVGLGSGESQPPLHHPDYDFPDALLEPGVAFWRLAVEALLSD